MQVPRRWITLVGLVMVGWLIATPTVSAQTDLEVLDQSQTAYYAGGGPSIDATQSVGQVFTAGISGTLSSIRVMVGRCEATTDAGAPIAVGDLIIELQTVGGATGLPADIALTSVTVAGSALQGPILTEAGWVAFTDASWTTVSFPSGVMLQLGSPYALVFRAATPGECNFYTTTAGANPYLGGHFAWRTDTGWNRVTWSPEALTEDVDFQTYVIPAPPLVIVTMLRSLVEGWGLETGITQRLTTKLLAAERAISVGRVTPACNQLRAVDALVTAQQSRALTADQASHALAIAAEVRTRLDC